MRIVFLGNGPFARPALAALLDSRHTVLAAVARPDRPQGKHLRIVPGPISQLAAERNLPLHQPEDVNASDFVTVLRGLGPEALVVADFGQILSRECLQTASLGGMNIHGSLLPKYRGAAPIVWAIYRGETETGVSIIHMTTTLDGGGVILQESIPIGANQTAGDIEPLLAELGARLVLQAIDLVESGHANPLPQDRALVTRAPKVSKDDARLDWRRSAVELHNQVRAMNPAPIAFCEWSRNKGGVLRLQVLASHPLPAQPADAAQPPGTVLHVGPGLEINTGAGRLAIDHLKPAGKNEMPIDAFLRGASITRGDRLL